MPGVVAGVREGEEDEVVGLGDESVRFGRGDGGDDVELGGDLLAVGVEWEIVDVVTEGIFKFAADGSETEDDVGGNYARLVKILRQQDV